MKGVNAVKLPNYLTSSARPKFYLLLILSQYSLLSPVKRANEAKI
jgi:hypothetical protein